MDRTVYILGQPVGLSHPVKYHTDECQLTCEHCPHGSDCYKACCWCGAVRDGEGKPQPECTCKVTP